MSNRFNSIDLEELAAHLCGVDSDNDDCTDQVEEKMMEKYNIDLSYFAELVNDLAPLLTMAISPLTEKANIGFGTKEIWLAKLPFDKFINNVLEWMDADKVRKERCSGFQRNITKGGAPEFELFLTNPGHTIITVAKEKKLEIIWNHLKEHLSEGREVCITPDSVLGHIVLGKTEGKEATSGI